MGAGAGFPRRTPAASSCGSALALPLGQTQVRDPERRCLLPSLSHGARVTGGTGRTWEGQLVSVGSSLPCGSRCPRPPPAGTCGFPRRSWTYPHPARFCRGTPGGSRTTTVLTTGRASV